MDPITSTLPAEYTQSTSGTPATKKVGDKQNEFLILLVAQLKGQNPMNPIEGSEFVAQLAQFSSLEELTKIRASMDEVQRVLTQPAATVSQTNADPSTETTDSKTTEVQN